jgi:hypothetical protein
MQMRNAQKEPLQRLGMGRPVATAAAHGRPHHQRRLHLPVVHGRVLGGVVDQLIRRQRHEVAKHDLRHRAVAAQRQPHAHPDNRGLADGGGEDARREAGGKPLGHFEGAAIRVKDILAQRQYGGILGHGLVQRLAQGRQIGQRHAHSAHPACWANVAGVCPGAASAAATAASSRAAISASMRLRSAGLNRVAAAASGSWARYAAISSGLRLSSPLEWGAKR